MWSSGVYGTNGVVFGLLGDVSLRDRVDPTQLAHPAVVPLSGVVQGEAPGLSNGQHLKVGGRWNGSSIEVSGYEVLEDLPDTAPAHRRAREMMNRPQPPKEVRAELSRLEESGAITASHMSQSRDGWSASVFAPHFDRLPSGFDALFPGGVTYKTTVHTRADLENAQTVLLEGAPAELLSAFGESYDPDLGAVKTARLTYLSPEMAILLDDIPQTVLRVDVCVAPQPIPMTP